MYLSTSTVLDPNPGTLAPYLRVPMLSICLCIRGVARIRQGGQEFFQIWKFCFEGGSPAIIFFLHYAIWCIFGSDFVYKFFFKLSLVVFFFSKKLPIVVVRDVCPSVRPSVRLSVRPSVVCGNNFFSR